MTCLVVPPQPRYGLLADFQIHWLYVLVLIGLALLTRCREILNFDRASLGARSPREKKDHSGDGSGFDVYVLFLPFNFFLLCISYRASVINYCCSDIFDKLYATASNQRTSKTDLLSLRFSVFDRRHQLYLS